MTRIKIFESARSEAGRNARNRLEAMADIARAHEQGADIEDADALPLALIDGKQAIAGRYPTRAELARWSGSSIIKVDPDAGNCCSGGNCG